MIPMSQINGRGLFMGSSSFFKLHDLPAGPVRTRSYSMEVESRLTKVLLVSSLPMK